MVEDVGCCDVETSSDPMNSDVMYDLPVKTHIISLHITARLNNHGKNEIENVQSAARLASARDVIRPRPARQNRTENTKQIPVRRIL